MKLSILLLLGEEQVVVMGAVVVLEDTVVRWPESLRVEHLLLNLLRMWGEVPTRLQLVLVVLVALTATEQATLTEETAQLLVLE
jgi:hypothetical protein